MRGEQESLVVVRSTVSLFGMVWMLVALTACGGPSSNDGKVGGHCYPNGTCNVGLTCVAGICSPVDAGVDAVPDAAPDAAVCADDSLFEPNNTVATAFSIELVIGGNNTRTITELAICPAGDVDNYELAVLEANTNIELLVDYEADGAALEASFLNSSGVAIAHATLQANPARRLRAFIPNLPIGTYYAQVRAPSGINDYQLTVNVNGGGCVDAVTPAAAAHMHAAGGTSNAGQPCLNAGCHDAGGGGPLFSFAGTVYTDQAAGTPKRGATIKVMFGGTTVSAVSDMDGNFYATQALSLPAKVLGTSCPTVAPMVGMIVAGGGNCNNCHNAGMSATTVPVYIP